MLQLNPTLKVGFKKEVIYESIRRQRSNNKDEPKSN